MPSKRVRKSVKFRSGEVIKIWSELLLFPGENKIDATGIPLSRHAKSLPANKTDLAGISYFLTNRLMEANKAGKSFKNQSRWLAIACKYIENNFALLLASPVIIESLFIR